MSVSTTGFVLLEKKDLDVFKVIAVIDNCTVDLVRRYAKDAVWKDKKSTFPRIELSPDSKHVRVKFQVNGEHRTLSVYFDCDYSEYGDSKIIWSVEAWGMAEEIVLSVCHAMKPFGKVFYRANDAISQDFEEMGVY